jgi:hypothetical protein
LAVCEQRKNKGKKSPHPEVQVPDHSGHQYIDEVARGAFQEVACQAVIGYQMADNRFNGGSALAALALFIALVSVVFFERWSE